ncbi:SprT family zinc-dependent metalloprotease [Alteromonas halophila]|uniref:SprT family zinc-dependent metalloprotease n=1 Tax=Alteromonas halophila TaxID=516698 RepID=UPI001E61966E|nr:SprT family zinc-dependent metalloprotease [Alteromonas halophila]
MTLWVFMCFACSVRFSNIATYDLTPELRRQVQLRVVQCYKRAEDYFGQAFRTPEITFRRSGKNAGTAFLQQNRLNFHPLLLRDNVSAFLEDVIPHEVSHLLVWHRFGKVKPHGMQWRTIMQDVFNCSPTTTHSFDTSILERDEFAYQCHCDTVMLSKRRHNTVLKGGNYRCMKCKQLLQRLAG